MEGFNLYREAKDHYDRIIPSKILGLILLALYEKYDEGDFIEEDINLVINKIHKDIGRESTRNEFGRNNNIVIELQDYFLWRDEIKRTYSFKPYGIEFCRKIHNRLEDSYRPATIKRWFDDLYNSLDKLVNENGDFNEWIEDHFNLKNSTLANQIEILDQQVIESVKGFKKQLKSEDESENILFFLKEIETNLDVIKGQVDELKKASQTTYDIDELLKNVLELQDSNVILKEIKRVRSFNDKVRAHLEQVSKRIEKIKPRIREFIYNFNQKDFDRKTELFLGYLLNHSSAHKKGNKKVLFPPEGILLKKVKDSNLLSKFTIVPLKEIRTKAPVEIPVRTIDTIQRTNLINKAKAWKNEKDRIAYWVNFVFTELNRNGKLDFSPLFFQILKEEEENLSIAVKTAHQVLIRITKSKGLNISIEQEEYNSPNFKNIALWKMTLQK